jgi:hypothetical protein
MVEMEIISYERRNYIISQVILAVVTKNDIFCRQIVIFCNQFFDRLHTVPFCWTSPLTIFFAGPLDTDAFIEYLKVQTPVSQELEHRITIISEREGLSRASETVTSSSTLLTFLIILLKSIL